MQKQIGKMLLQIRLELKYTLEDYCSKLNITVFDYLKYESGFFIAAGKEFENILDKIKHLSQDNTKALELILKIEKMLN